jgi:hypothetical protein
MNNNITPMPTQNPWAWVGMGMGMGTQCRALLHTVLEGPTEGVCECKMDVNVYMDSYMISNGSCFMVTWTTFKNCLLGITG